MAVKKKPIKRKTPMEAPDTYEIEKNPPKEALRATEAVIQLRTERLEATLAVVEKGQAFIMPNNEAGWARLYLKKYYPNRVYAQVKIMPDKKRVRFTRLK